MHPRGWHPNPTAPVAPTEHHPGPGIWKVLGPGCSGLRAFLRCWGLIRACLHTELFLN